MISFLPKLYPILSNDKYVLGYENFKKYITLLSTKINEPIQFKQMI